MGEYVKSAPGLANSFFIPYGQSLTETSNTLKCPTSKVKAITGQDEMLQGGYATVSGYSYAVNAGSWNDYTGGVMTSQACGPMGADYQDHCVMATGSNSTAPTPYWIVRNSWS